MRVVSKTVFWVLKPTVFTFAMLFATVSIFVWWARRPEMAENIERSTGVSWGGGVGGGAPGQAEKAVMRPTGTDLPPMTAVASVDSVPRMTEPICPVTATPSSPT